MLGVIISNPPLFLTGVFIFGLLIGSFLNVVILRLPARLEHMTEGDASGLTHHLDL